MYIIPIEGENAQVYSLTNDNIYYIMPHVSKTTDKIINHKISSPFSNCAHSEQCTIFHCHS